MSQRDRREASFDRDSSSDTEDYLDSGGQRRRLFKNRYSMIPSLS